MAEPSVRAFLPGIYPRSEQLVQTTRDLDRGRTSEEAVEQQLARDLGELIAVQQAAGMDLLADGMLRWQDLFRPLVEACEGLEPGPLTRFLDTNTFFRAPRVSGSPSLRTPLDERYVAPLPGPRLVTLPSPLAFAKAAGATPREIAANVLAPALEGLEAELVVLSEPFLAREESPDLDSFADALDELSGGPPLVVQIVFADARPLLPRLLELPVHGLGIDFYGTGIEAVPEGFSGLLLAGVVDARASTVEDAQALVPFVERLRTRVEGDIALVPNGDLQFVAEPIARRKVEALGAAKTALVEVAA